MKGIIYKIEGYGLTYYGSTIQPLSERKASHKSKFKNNGLYCSSWEILKNGDDWEMTKIEDVEFDDIDELRLREAYYQKNNECVNKFKLKTKEEMKQYKKEWAEKDRRAKGARIKSEMTKTKDKNYKNNWIKNKRANETPEEKEQRLIKRRERYKLNKHHYINIYIMKLLPLAISARQASRLRNGHKVRVKHGAGFNVVVNPDTYQILTRTFVKNKGAELKLSDEELEANRGISPEEHQRKIDEEDDDFHLPKLMEGGSLFGKVKRGVNKFLKSKTAKQIGSVLKPIGKQLAKEGVKQLAKGANESVDPKYKPAVSVITGALSKKANQSIDGLGIKHKRLHRLNKETGTNHGYLGRAGIDNAIAGSKNAELIKASIDSRHNISNAHTDWDDPLAPRSRGTGISHSSRRPVGILEGRGTLHRSSGGLPPALQSQPHGINYQFRHTLPPQFQDRMGGNGLYA